MHFRTCVALLLCVVACRSVRTAPSGEAPAAAAIFQPESEPIATIGGAGVPLPRFNTLYRERAARAAPPAKLSAEAAFAIKRALADELIEDQLVEQEAHRRGVTASEAQVAGALRDLAAGFPDRGAYQRYATEYPGGEAELRENARQRVLRDALSGFDPRQPVTDREARAFYDAVHPRSEPRSLAEARPEIERTLRLSRRSTRLAALLASLRASTRIDDHLRARYPALAAPAVPAAMGSTRELKIPPGASTKPGGQNHVVPLGPR
jgi:hypothetical protein